MNHTGKRTPLTVIASLLCLLISIPATADEAIEQTWRVARVSHLDGSSSIKLAEQEEWAAATINAPLMAGDQFYTSANGRAEIQLEDNVVVWLGRNTLIRFNYMQTDLTRIELIEGAMTLHAQDVPFDRPPIEVLGQFFLATVADESLVRFDAQPSGDAEIQVRDGEIRINKSSDTFLALYERERLIVSNPNPDTYTKLPVRAEDAFDGWVRNRLTYRTQLISQASQLNPRLAGHEELHQHGTWLKTSEYGQIWRPDHQPADWAPYRDGHWVWRDYSGWTWVSNEPWGWVPYHYGRWVYVDSNWCWAPTERVIYPSYTRTTVVYRRPVWYPALVSFAYSSYGDGYGFSFAYASSGSFYDRPHIGWFPLGYHDPYHWRWGHWGGTRFYNDGDVIINNGTINVNNGNIDYDNINVEGALTVMAERDLSTGVYDQKAAATFVNTSSDREVLVGQAALAAVPTPRSGKQSGSLLASSQVSPSRSQSSVRVSEKRLPGSKTRVIEIAQADSRDSSSPVQAMPRSLTSKAEAPSSIATRADRSGAVQDIARRSTVASARGQVAMSPTRVASAERSASKAQNRSARSSVTSSPSRSNAGSSPQVEQRSSRDSSTASRITASRPSTSESRTSVTARSTARNQSSQQVDRSSRPSRSSAANISPNRASGGSSRSASVERNESRSTLNNWGSIRSRSAYQSSITRRAYPSAAQRRSIEESRSQAPTISSPRSQARTESSRSSSPSVESSPKRSSDSSYTRNSGVYSTPRIYNKNNRGAYTLSPPRSFSSSRDAARSPSSSQSRSSGISSPSRGQSLQSSGSSSRSYSMPSRSYTSPSRDSSRYSSPTTSRSSRSFTSPSRSRSFMSSPSRRSSSRFSSPSRSTSRFSSPSRSSSIRSFSSPRRSSSIQSSPSRRSMGGSSLSSPSRRSSASISSPRSSGISAPRSSGASRSRSAPSSPSRSTSAVSKSRP